MSALSCGEVRKYLAGVRSGTPPALPPESFELLRSRGAVAGDVGAPQITPVGSHVLAELEVRAKRTDPMPLDDFAAQMDRVLRDLDAVAKTAEYFLAELGPVTPPEAVPRLRPLAIGLANRRSAPEELAEQFRNIWGGVEVMGGDSRDRLMAAELLQAAAADMESIYSPMMTTSATVRESSGPAAPAVTVAAILHLHPTPEGRPRLAEYQLLRKSAATEEGAAMLAATGREPTALLADRQMFLTQLAGAGAVTPDIQVAAGFLCVVGADPARDGARVRALAAALQDRSAVPYTLAAILSTVPDLEPAELIDWVRKATDIARARRLAPTPAELTVLGSALVAGLPMTEFSGTDRADRPRLSSLADLVALNAWAYARALAPATAAPAAAAR